MQLSRRDVIASTAALACSSSCAWPSTLLYGTSVTIPDDFFGLHVSNASPMGIYGQKQTPFPHIGERAIRLWESGTAWRNLNPAPNQFDFNRLDYRVSEAKANNCEIMLTLGQPPDWAAKPNPTSRGENPNPPYRIEDWTKYVDAVSRRYNGQINYYEIWNEVNLLSGFNGTLQELLTLQMTAVNILRSTAPTALILSPNFAPPDAVPDQSATSLAAWLKAGGAMGCDAVSFHAYAGDRNPPEDAFLRIAEARSTLAHYGAAHLPLFDTESGPRGWRDADGNLHNLPRTGFGEPLPSSPVDMQSAWLTRHLLSVALSGVRQSYFFLYDNPDGAQGTHSIMAIDMTEYPDHPDVLRRPAIAYRFLATLLAGGRIVAAERKGDFIRVDFAARDGRTGYASWSTGAPLELPLSPGQHVTDNAGAPLRVGSTIRLTQSPVFVFY